jgi:hypothetical protein
MVKKREFDRSLQAVVESYNRKDPWNHCIDFVYVDRAQRSERGEVWPPLGYNMVFQLSILRSKGQQRKGGLAPRAIAFQTIGTDVPTDRLGEAETATAGDREKEGTSQTGARRVNALVGGVGAPTGSAQPVASAAPDEADAEVDDGTHADEQGDEEVEL